MANRPFPDPPRSPSPVPPSAEARDVKRPPGVPPKVPASSTAPKAPASAPPKAPVSAPPKVSASPSVRTRVTPEARRQLIAENAYRRAERRGFDPGHEDEDWLAAEGEVDALLRAQQGAPQ
jgi:Protein of unknown function (DUF2934)